MSGRGVRAGGTYQIVPVYQAGSSNPPVDVLAPHETYRDPQFSLLNPRAHVASENDVIPCFALQHRFSRASPTPKPPDVCGGKTASSCEHHRSDHVERGALDVSFYRALTRVREFEPRNYHAFCLPSRVKSDKAWTYIVKRAITIAVVLLIACWACLHWKLQIAAAMARFAGLKLEPERIPGPVVVQKVQAPAPPTPVTLTSLVQPLFDRIFSSDSASLRRPPGVPVCRIASSTAGWPFSY
jgi:hypothetical protein